MFSVEIEYVLENHCSFVLIQRFIILSDFIVISMDNYLLAIDNGLIVNPDQGISLS